MHASALATLAFALTAPALAQHLEYDSPRIGDREVISRWARPQFRIPRGVTSEGLIRGERLQLAAFFYNAQGNLINPPIEVVPYEIPFDLYYGSEVENKVIFWNDLDESSLHWTWLKHAQLETIRFGVKTASGTTWLMTPVSADEAIDHSPEVDAIRPRLLRAVRSQSGDRVLLVFSENMSGPGSGYNGSDFSIVQSKGCRISFDGAFPNSSREYLPYDVTGWADSSYRVASLARRNGAEVIPEGWWIRPETFVDIANNYAHSIPVRVTVEGSCRHCDLDADGMVGPSDLGLLLSSWGEVQLGALADLDLSSTVDSADISQLLGAWGVCP